MHPSRRESSQSTSLPKRRANAARRWANSGIGTLNRLMGDSALAGADLTIPACAAAATRHIGDVSSAFPAPPSDLGCPDDCYRSLLGSTPVYQSDRVDVKPYVRDDMSWPEVGSSRVILTESLLDGDRHRLRGWKQVLLRSDGEIDAINDACGEARCYNDPVIFTDPRTYGDF